MDKLSWNTTPDTSNLPEDVLRGLQELWRQVVDATPLFVLRTRDSINNFHQTLFWMRAFFTDQQVELFQAGVDTAKVLQSLNKYITALNNEDYELITLQDVLDFPLNVEMMLDDANLLRVVAPGRYK